MKSEFSFFKKIFLSNFNTLNLPYRLNFSITNKCNYKCKICNIWKRESSNELTLDEIEKIFQKSNFFSWISLTGGEPFLKEDIASIARIISKNCKDLFVLNIPTNGSLPDLINEKVEEIAKFKIPNFIVTVSLDGPKEIHNAIRNNKKAWQNSISTFKNLKKISERNRNFKVFFEFTISPYNIKKFREAYESAKEKIKNLKPSDFHINLFHYSPHYYSNLNIKVPENFRENSIKDIDDILKFREKIEKSPTYFLPQLYLIFAKSYVKTNKNPLNCKALISSCFLDAEGNVFPCICFNKNLGNVRNFDYDLRKILASSKSKINEKINNNCPNCWTPCDVYPTILGNIFDLVRNPKVIFFNEK